MTQMQYRTCAYQPANNASQRIAGLAFIGVLHAGVIYALLISLQFFPMPPVPKPFEWHIITDDGIVPPPPIPQDPAIPRPRITDIAPPIIDLQLEPGPAAITEPVAPPSLPPAQQSQRVVTLEPPPPLPLTLTPARAIAATHTIPEYPPASRRLGEQGTLRLRVDITADGTVNAAQVETSSGHPRLDDAAVQWVKAHWRYDPAREGTKPVASTAVAVVTFKLQ